MIRAVIVDDEAPARALLAEYLAAHADIEIVAECANGFEAVKRIGELAPDLVLLDVQMPRLDGFEVVELLDPAPAVIFVTAYDEYALRAFDVHAVDYVLKPVARDRLARAIGAAREKIGRMPAAALLSADARPPGRFMERIVVKDGASVHVVPIDRIDCIEAQDDYVAIHAGGREFLKPQPLATIERGLDPARFVRIHRSHLVNIDRVARIELAARDSRVVVMKDGRELPVSRAGYARLRELLDA